MTDETMTQEVRVEDTLSTNPNPLLTTLACTSCANAGTIRNVSLAGRNYVVFPVVPIREGVLNGHYVSAREIERATPGWNGRPLTLRHPMVGNEHVSANAPDTWEQFGVGWVFNAAYTDGRMVAEGWIDTGRLATLGYGSIVPNLSTGLHMDVSTGYFCDVFDKEGVFKGENFVGVQSGIVPDHLALLPDQRGACSWDDGCGIPRVNSGGIMEVQEGVNAPVVEVVEDAVVNAAPIVIDDAPVTPIPVVHAVREAELAAIEAASAPLVTPALPAELVELSDFLREVGGIDALRQTLANVQNDAAARRAESVNRVVSLSANALAPADLEGVSEDVLAKFAQALQPTNFAGRVANSAPAATAEQWVVLAPGQKGV